MIWYVRYVNSKGTTHILKDKSQLKAKKQKLLKKETNKQTNPEEFYYRFYICRKKSIVMLYNWRKRNIYRFEQLLSESLGKLELHTELLSRFKKESFKNHKFRNNIIKSHFSL
jgi:hypothetical protein